MRRGPMLLALFAAGILSLAAIPTHAATVLYDFNCALSGGGCTSTSTDYGFIQFGGSYDISGPVNLYVELSNPDWKLIEFGFNTDAPFAGFIPYALSGDSTSLNYDLNNVKPDGYSYRFDFAVPATGNLGNVYTFTGDLTSGGFFQYLDYISEAKDTGNYLFAYAHIGNLDGGNSIWVGAGTPSVPEPSTLLLLGSGLVGLVGFRRKKFKV